MIAPATLFLANKDGLWPALLGVGASLAFVAWSYLTAAGPKPLRLACAALKFFGLVAVLACFVEPASTSKRAKPGANLFAVVADNSLSMKLAAGRDHQTRGEALQAALTGPASGWRSHLAENFGVRNYLADSRLHPTEDFHELDFTGRASALNGALHNLAERYHGQPLAGVLLLTDGAASDAEAVDFSGLPPVYPVVFGEKGALRDLGVAGTSVTQTSFEDAPVTVQIDVAALGCGGEDVLGKLFEIDPANLSADPKPVAEQTLTAPREDKKLVFRFQLRPDKNGVLFYRFRTGLKKEWDAKPEATSEVTLLNNETTVCVDRGSNHQRVLYVAGRPSWEYKFLHRAIQEDTQTQLVGLIRVAKKEAKFEFRGRSGESSNPLFRGFGNQSKEDLEQYNQPVMVRLDTEDEFELREGFPKTPEELFKYRAVIIGDVESEFFTPDQMSLLQRFVSDRGGGFLMHGGAESFIDGKFDRTAIGDMLPIYLDKPTAPEPLSGELHLSLTREGWLQPWARLRDNESDEKKRLGELPRFLIFNRVGEVKPAAMVVATVNDGQKDYPAIVTQRFGRGRTAALLMGDLWHLGLGEEERQKDLLKAWRQIVRWLVADTPDQIELHIEPQPDSESVKLQVRARDARFEPLDNAAVALKVTPLGAAQPVSLTAEASTNEPGLYESTFVPHESSGYRVEATVTNENGAVAGTAQAGWTTDLAATEFRSLAPNRAFMEALAQKTGGAMVEAGQLEAFVRDLPSKRAPITESSVRPLWHTPAVFFFALVCFIGEWGLRRWKGLA